MGDWEEAELGGQMQTKEPEMTTDDLVLMVGESVISRRHAERIVAHLRQEIATLHQNLAKEKSIRASLKEQVNTLDADNNNKAGKISELEANVVKANESLRSRILQLESQVHQVALERDAARKDTRDALDEINALKAVKTKKKSTA